jgi:GDP-mannose 6-dehydrogenase
MEHESPSIRIRVMGTSQTSHQAAVGRQTIALFGLGYVGCVSACCLAKSGYRVLGVEVIPEKIAALNRGEISFVEPGLPELAREMVAAGRLRALANPDEAAGEAEISMICVGTPGGTDGYPNLSRLFEVCTRIGNVLRDKPGIHDVVIRSTVLPGTAERCAELIAAASGKREGDGFRVLVNPEFLREGTALKDYQHPPFTIIGAQREQDAQRVRELYAGIAAPLVVLPRREAELVKFSCNLFHAVKVVFANEMGRLGRAAGVDTHRVMEVFCQDDKLNISRSYLMPGYAYGGSCLPKDLQAILAYAQRHQIELPMLVAVNQSNAQQIDLSRRLIQELGMRRVALFGLSFKPTTDDLRGSPLVLLAEALLQDGFELRIYDPHVRLEQLLGENKSFLARHLPTASQLLCDNLEELLDWGHCLVIGNRLPEVSTVLARASARQAIVDLVRAGERIHTAAAYHGLGWQIEPERP